MSSYIKWMNALPYLKLLPCLSRFKTPTQKATLQEVAEVEDIASHQIHEAASAAH